MKKYTSLLLLIGLSLLPLFPLLAPGLPITHDGKDHVARIANFYANLTNGNVIPRWGGNLNWGYGHPVLMFLYPLPSYIASIFRFLGFSFIDSTKLVFGSMFIISGLTMYVWLRTFLRKEAAFLGALLYLFAPYRFVDLYVRGAIGEHVAFVFPPLICYFLHQLFESGKIRFIILGGFAIAGLILAHNAISLMFFPFIIGYILILSSRKKQQSAFLLKSMILIAYGFFLSAFFWIPAFFEGKYTLRDIVSSKDYTDRLYPLSKFFFNPWGFGITGQFSLQIGFVQWIFVAISGVTMFLHRRKLNVHIVLLGFALMYFFATLFLMLHESVNVWNNISLLQKFQFPWRFLSVSVFTTAIMGAIISHMIFTKRQRMFFILTIFVVVTTVPFWRANGYLIKPDSFFSGIYPGTTDTGESTPRWSVRFMEHYPKAPLEVIQGSAAIEQLSRTITEHHYRVVARTTTILRENTLYFPGWRITVDGKEVGIEFQDPHNRGVMVFQLPSGEHSITASFHETKLRFLANTITLISFFALFFFAVVIKVIKRNRVL